MTLTGYNTVDLKEMLEELGEEKTKKILLTFSCPYNEDVEYFLHHKAIEFSKQQLSNTFLVVCSHKGLTAFIGYFTIADKVISLTGKHNFSNRLRSRISKFATYHSELKAYLVSAPLIGQLGKNYSNNFNTLISGDELLQIACDKIREAQRILGGKIVYLECEDTIHLKNFYERNGFYEFGKRLIEDDELNKGKYLIKMIKYLIWILKWLN